MPTYPIPANLRSTDPEVIAACRQHEEAWLAFVAEAEAFATKYGVSLDQTWGTSEPHALVSGFGSKRVGAITGSKPQAGQWKRTKRGWAPFVKNPIHAAVEGHVPRV